MHVHIKIKMSDQAFKTTSDQVDKVLNFNSSHPRRGTLTRHIHLCSVLANKIFHLKFKTKQTNKKLVHIMYSIQDFQPHLQIMGNKQVLSLAHVFYCATWTMKLWPGDIINNWWCLLIQCTEGTHITIASKDDANIMEDLRMYGKVSLGKSFFHRPN